MRDHGLIDNGVSDVIAECIETMTGDVIRQELNLANTAAMIMQGLISDPSNVGSPKQLAEVSINHAKALFETLDQERAYNASQSIKLDS